MHQDVFPIPVLTQRHLWLPPGDLAVGERVWGPSAMASLWVLGAKCSPLLTGFLSPPLLLHPLALSRTNSSSGSPLCYAEQEESQLMFIEGGLCVVG